MDSAFIALPGVFWDEGLSQQESRGCFQEKGRVDMYSRVFACSSGHTFVTGGTRD